MYHSLSHIFIKEVVSVCSFAKFKHPLLVAHYSLIDYSFLKCRWVHYSNYMPARHNVMHLMFFNQKKKKKKFYNYPLVSRIHCKETLNNYWHKNHQRYIKIDCWPTKFWDTTNSSTDRRQSCQEKVNGW